MREGVTVSTRPSTESGYDPGLVEMGAGVGRVTLQTIADQVGVSRMTVSNAFSRPDQLSPTLRDRILLAAEDLGYTGPDPAARALARGTTGAVGVMLTESLGLAFTDEVATGFLGAVANALAPTGLALTLLTGTPESTPAQTAGSSGGTEPSGVIPARDVAIDGALIYSCDVDSPGTEWLLKRRLPLVFVDQENAPGRTSVNIDDYGGARQAAQHLVGLGHRRIGIVASGHQGPYGLIDAPVSYHVAGRVAGERMRGWLDVLTPAGITPQIVRTTTYSPDDERAAANLLLDAAEPPSAIICLSDAIAQIVVNTALDRGLRVPQDLSVTGFDDSPLAARMRPGLTTVRQDLAAKGQAAIEALVARIQARGELPPEAIVISTELVIRESTAPPPAR